MRPRTRHRQPARRRHGADRAAARRHVRQRRLADRTEPEWNGKLIADLALKSGILLSPCDFFMLRAPETIWFRFNVAYADHPQLLTFLRQLCRP
jgi:DNA-binding transcriptional MocR family regulator